SKKKKAENSARAEADIGRTNARVNHQYEIDVVIAERMDDLMAVSDQRFAKRGNHAVSPTPRPGIRLAANRNLHDVLPRRPVFWRARPTATGQSGRARACPA